MKKKILILLSVSLLILSLCSGCIPDLTPPIEPPETSNRVVMVELFVAPTCPNCPAAKNYIGQLLQLYGFDQLVVLEEYGWDYGEYTGWATEETRDRFIWYSGYTRRTPDAYFNGINQTVHHNEYSYNTYKEAIDAELAKPAKISISALCDITNSPVSITGNIENISSEDLYNIVIGAMIYEDSVYLGTTKVNHVVRDIITTEESGETIASFAPGDSHQFSLTSSSLSNVHDMSNIHVVVYVQALDSPTKEILQALYVGKN